MAVGAMMSRYAALLHVRTPSCRLEALICEVSQSFVPPSHCTCILTEMWYHRRMSESKYTRISSRAQSDHLRVATPTDTLLAVCGDHTPVIFDTGAEDGGYA